MATGRIQAVQSAAVAGAYSPAVIYDGNAVFVSGQLALDSNNPTGGLVGEMMRRSNLLKL